MKNAIIASLLSVADSHWYASLEQYEEHVERTPAEFLSLFPEGTQMHELYPGGKPTCFCIVFLDGYEMIRTESRSGRTFHIGFSAEDILEPLYKRYQR